MSICVSIDDAPVEAPPAHRKIAAHLSTEVFLVYQLALQTSTLSLSVQPHRTFAESAVLNVQRLRYTSALQEYRKHRRQVPEQ